MLNWTAIIFCFLACAKNKKRNILQKKSIWLNLTENKNCLTAWLRNQTDVRQGWIENILDGLIHFTSTVFSPDAWRDTRYGGKGIHVGCLEAFSSAFLSQIMIVVIAKNMNQNFSFRHSYKLYSYEKYACSLLEINTVKHLLKHKFTNEITRLTKY